MRPRFQDQDTLPLPLEFSQPATRPRPNFLNTVASFAQFGTVSREIGMQATTFDGATVKVPVFINEFWTAKQRAANSLQEISYRACFKPQLPRFFIERLTAPGDCVYDPFMGRGTTVLEAALLGRQPVGCDLNPLSVFLTRPRLQPPQLSDVSERLENIPWDKPGDCPEDLLVFYHPQTLAKLSALKNYLVKRARAGKIDAIDDWIRLIALNRLTGHSPGFFSVYTMPPNQAVSVKSQRKINERRKQTPPLRDITRIILKKSRILLSDCDAAVRATLVQVERAALLVTAPAARTPKIASESVDLVVTSPPFLDTVDYAGDNWLRCWFVGIDPTKVSFTVPKRLDDWREAMTKVFAELFRVVRTGGHVAFEVGEVRGGSVKLEDTVIPCGIAAGLKPVLVMINDQKFTKTANCWGVDNNSLGTNTNRIVVFTKPSRSYPQRSCRRE